jgi:hypothetical protein
MSGKPLDNPRWESFALMLAQGMTASKAYEAHFRGDRRNAARLANNPNVKVRVEELVEEAEAAHPTNYEGLKGADALQHLMVQNMGKTGNQQVAVAAAKELMAYDGSGDALSPDISKMSPSDLASHCLPFTRALLAKCYPDQSLPPDEAIIAAFVTACGPDTFATTATDAAPTV